MNDFDFSFAIGQSVKCHEPGSWVDGKVGVIKRLNTKSSDGIFGHLLQMDCGVTVLPPHCLELVENQLKDGSVDFIMDTRLGGK